MGNAFADGNARTHCTEECGNGRIDGHAKVLVEREGDFTLKGKVDGSSILFLKISGTCTIEEKVDGNAKIVGKCGRVEVKEKVDGQAQILVTGSISSTHTNGSAVCRTISVAEADVLLSEF